jgi:hypothetical protein
MQRGAAFAVVFAVYFALAGLLILPAPLLYDGDSYYHLAVARLYAEEGIFAKIPWGRFSLLRDGGDKDFLFHLALMPAAQFGADGGRFALTLINAAIGALLALAAMRAMGPVGALVPLWLWIAAPPFFGRMVRLRPELFALAIILLALVIRWRRRGLALTVLAFLFTLSYTAFHVFLALCALWFAVEWWSTKRAEWSTLAGPFAGAVAGLLLRPYPIANLKLWFVQNVSFFMHKARLDVGSEIEAPDLWYFTSALPWLAGAVVLLIGHKPWREADADARRAIAATIVFTILFLLFSRMAVYFFPLATLAVLSFATTHAADKRPLHAIALLLLIAGAIPTMISSRAFKRLWTEASPEAEWQAFGAAVPKNARVASDWAMNEVYAFFAPQGRYLNVLDPVFMALPYPREHAALQRIFRGVEPDAPYVIKEVLDSDYVAFSTLDVPRPLIERLQRDPRVTLVRGGINILARIDKSDAFVTNWTPQRTSAFIRVERGACETFRTDLRVTQLTRFEFAPHAKGTLTIDGRRIVETKSGVILGHGPVVAVPPTQNARHIEVTTCRASDGIGGFYLLRR